MNANIIIDAKDAGETEISSINMSMQLNTKFSTDIMGVISALLLKMLTNDDIMKIFNLRACEVSNLQKNMEQNSRGFKADIIVNRNNAPQHNAVLGPRPCDKAIDTSIRLHISAQC